MNDRAHTAQASPEAVEALRTLLTARLGENRNAEAVEVANVLLQFVPDHREALYGKAVALIRMKEVSLRAQARDALERLMQLEPNHVDAAMNLARIYLAIGPLPSAGPMLEKLAKMLPGHAEVAAMANDLRARLAETVVVQDKPEPARWGAPPPAAPRQRKFTRARYPAEVAVFDDLRGAVKKYIIGASEPADRFLRPGARGFTMGSCFAGRIGRELNRLGQETFHLQLAETVNTTFANLEFLRWILGTDDGRSRAYFEAEMSARRIERAQVLEILGKADFLIYTMGVAPAFFHKATGKYVPHAADDFKQFEFLAEHEYRTSTMPENVANLVEIRSLLLKVRPDLALVLTVSPVPLSATFEMESAVVADCVSKSILRSAAHEFIRTAGAGTVYWPSYEMVRWLGGHIGRVFGTDDGSNHHVSDSLVTMIVELFIERFRSAPPAEAP